MKLGSCHFWCHVFDRELSVFLFCLTGGGCDPHEGRRERTDANRAPAEAARLAQFARRDIATRAGLNCLGDNLWSHLRNNALGVNRNDTNCAGDRRCDERRFHSVLPYPQNRFSSSMRLILSAAECYWIGGNPQCSEPQAHNSRNP